MAKAQKQSSSKVPADCELIEEFLFKITDKVLSLRSCDQDIVKEHKASRFSDQFKWMMGFYAYTVDQDEESELVHADFVTDLKFKNKIGAKIQLAIVDNDGNALMDFGEQKTEYTEIIGVLKEESFWGVHVPIGELMDKIGEHKRKLKNIHLRAIVKYTKLDVERKSLFPFTHHEEGELSATVPKVKKAKLSKAKKETDSDLFDFTFKMEDGREINVKKANLTQKWPYFDATINGKAAKSVNVVGGHDYDTMNSMLTYIQSGTITIKNRDEMMKLFNAARQYEVIQLLKICENLMKQELTLATVIDTLILAHESVLTDLKNAALDFIVEAKSIKMLKQFEDMSNHEKLNPKDHPILLFELTKKLIS